ncbi:IS1380 family transposase [Mycobacterium sp. SMC-18]|uniref:IS1380 family transposase n=4 Tax=Mycobacteriaceae TaxID=1762 RepID=A0A6H0S1C0_9MYCO|nr:MULTISPECIES: IS1380 family transposase [Mycolicibacterium]MCV7216350.1 IS1380 family transposase [Mycolicibacterium crocinum]QIV79827.1 IS1380 family transposase [Mycolicibacterium frederiksbergense]QIV79870.1 IS1380 family transposase [Mycolicibacterium frederiksbergense]ULN39235.1 IS1380 family transposase [Mycolicibacterium crocinum]ULN39555.1 IS1380 family transposase [Mycolicibacterium crocinum]
MQLSHTRPVASARFDDPNLVSCAGLVPMAALAHQCGLSSLADEHITVPTDKGANAGAKVLSLVAGMVAGADSIDDMALLRHGAMGTVFDRPYAPSTLGSFLREFSFGHVRQLDAVAARLLAGLHERTPVLAGVDGPVCVDLDDTIIEVHGYTKQGSGYGYSGVRGLNALIATLTTEHGAPIICGQRLRKGACGSARGAARIVGDTLATVTRLRSSAAATRPLLRADSAFYGYPTVAAALRGGADVSITVRLDPKVKAAIAAIPEDAWISIQYTDAIYDENTQRWISRAEVAEIDFTAFSSRKTSEQIPGRLVVRRIPDLNPASGEGQTTLFDTWRFHAFFTTTDLDTVTADKTHRGHALIEQVHADLKDSALAHLPSGRFGANAAWLVCAAMAFNLTRAAATLTGPALAKARTGTIRRTLISVPARIASSARRLTLHLPRNWPWETAWNTLFHSLFGRNRPLLA